MIFFDYYIGFVSAISKQDGIKSLLGGTTMMTTILTNGVIGILFFLINYNESRFHIKLYLLCILVAILYYFIFDFVHKTITTRSKRILEIKNSANTLLSVFIFIISIMFCVLMILLNIQNALGVDVIYELFVRNSK